MSRLLDVTRVIARPDYNLMLVFENGEVRIFDARPLLDKRPFDRLQDPAVFALAFVDPALGTVCWPGEIDIAPETLYDGSVPATRETLKYELEDLLRGAGRLEEVDWGPDVGLERVDPPPEDEDR